MSEYIVDFGSLAMLSRIVESESNRLGEPVVRCRDCKHYRQHEFILITDVDDVCLFWAEGVKVKPDGFCAWGERRNA